MQSVAALAQLGGIVPAGGTLMVLVGLLRAALALQQSLYQLNLMRFLWPTLGALSPMDTDRIAGTRQVNLALLRRKGLITAAKVGNQ